MRENVSGDHDYHRQIVLYAAAMNRSDFEGARPDPRGAPDGEPAGSRGRAFPKASKQCNACRAGADVEIRASDTHSA